MYQLQHILDHTRVVYKINSPLSPVILVSIDIVLNNYLFLIDDRYLYSLYEYIYIYTWNPNDPCFGWKRPCFGGLTFKNRGHLGCWGSRYIYIYWILCAVSRALFFGRRSDLSSLETLEVSEEGDTDHSAVPKEGFIMTVNDRSLCWQLVKYWKGVTIQVKFRPLWVMIFLLLVILSMMSTVFTPLVFKQRTVRLF